MFGFFKESIPEGYDVPEEHIEEILHLADCYQSLPGGQDRAARYRLWKKIEEVIPQVKIGGGNWVLDNTGATKLRIRRKTKKDK